MSRGAINRRVLIVTMNGDGPDTGFAVRVIAIAETLQKSGCSVTLLRLYPALKSQGTWRRRMQTCSIRIIEIPVLPTARWSLLRALSFAIASQIIRLVVKRYRIEIIQAEAHEAGLAVLRRRPSDTRVVVDFHGAAPEESRQRSGLTSEPHWLDAAEVLCLQRADAALVVSTRMQEHLKAKHPTLTLPECFMVPVNVDESFFVSASKERGRKSLGFGESDLVYIYSGGAQFYQCIEEMAALFEVLRSRNVNARLLVISGQLEICRRMVRENCSRYFREIVFRSVQKPDMPGLLCAGDIAFLLRKNHVLNTVSCPTKFGEYLACGIPVVTTPWAGHAPNVISHHGVGVVVDCDRERSVDCIEALASRLSSELSQRCSEVARETMHWTFSEKTLLDCIRFASERNRADRNDVPSVNDGAPK